MTRREKLEYLKSNGWDDYLHPEYLVHPDSVENPLEQDYRDYGLSVDIAFIFHQNQLPKFKPGIPVNSIMSHMKENKDVYKEYVPNFAYAD